jgi:DNA-binding HxlR family transcriptional regulator
MLGDRWTMLVVRELVTGPKRTMELLSSLYPISSRTLVGRLRDMERDHFLERTDFGGNPPHIEYELTQRGRLLLPLLESLRELGMTLGCNDCEDRLRRVGNYCESCPLNVPLLDAGEFELPKSSPSRHRDQDESIVLL